MKGKIMRKTSTVDQISKFMFLLAIVIALVGGGFLYGVFAYRDGLFPIAQLKTVKNLITEEGFWAQNRRVEHLQPSRAQGSGVTINNLPDDGAQILITGFFDNENQIRLIKRNGTIVKKWSLDFFDHFPNADIRACEGSSALGFDTHGVHLTPKGEVVFNYEYCGSVKLDQCGKVVWNINKPTHHSIVPAEAGGYWVLSRLNWNAKEEPNRFPPFSSSGKDKTIHEDTILRISEDGQILEEISIPVLMLKNNLEALLTSNGLNFNLKHVLNNEIVHANKVAELPASLADYFPLFAARDLAISLRELNLILVIDPISKKIKWHQTGPWIRQHDPEFRQDGRISIFNNNVYRIAYENEQTKLNNTFSTNIIAVDPVSRKTEVIFGEKTGQEMLSVIRGQHELLKNDGMLITEFDAGRVFEVDSDKNIVWEYVNQYDDKYVGEITNAVLYPAGYFQEKLHNCKR